MADEKLSEIFIASPVTVAPGQLAYSVTNRGTTPDEGAFDYAQLMFNRYRIVVTVSSNDLIVSLKHEDGTTDPSADFPLYFKIANSLRAVTAATSITIVDGTNWFDAGSPRFGGKVHPFFVYLVWDSNSSVVAISIASIPYATLVSDFSATTTNEKHLYNYANFTSTDDVINIGYFEATLSLVATSYLWTVATFTSANLKSFPTFESRWMDYTCVPTQGYSSVPTNTVYQYQLRGRNLYLTMREGTNGTSNTTSGGIYPLPFTAKALTDGLWFSFAFIANNSVTDNPGYAFVVQNTSNIQFNRAADAAYTSSGGRRVNLQSGFYYPLA